jgi:hypothetical protein
MNTCWLFIDKKAGYCNEKRDTIRMVPVRQSFILYLHPHKGEAIAFVLFARALFFVPPTSRRPNPPAAVIIFAASPPLPKR